MEIKDIIKDYEELLRGVDKSAKHCHYQYRNDKHLLFIKEINKTYSVCGLGCGFYTVSNCAGYDVYYTTKNFDECLKVFEKFIDLLLHPIEISGEWKKLHQEFNF